jgi:signal recognition particle subunit SEC65
MLDDAREEVRKEHETKAVESLGYDYAQEVTAYWANPDRAGKKCYIDASAHWSAWSGMPKAEFAACDQVVRQGIIGIREKDEQARAVAKAERAERRKGMSEVAARLDEMDERQADRERELDRRDAARQAAADAIAREKARTEAMDAEVARAKRISCTMGNKRSC